MSWTEIMAFNKEGNAVYHSDVENSWRGAMAVWSNIGKKYLGDKANALFNPKPIWDLYKDNSISRTDRIVLGSTFDRALIKKENLNEVIEAYIKFEEEHGNTSLKEQADRLKEILDSEEYIAVAFNQTDVVENQWVKSKYDEEKDEEHIWSYNCLKSKDHFWLIEDINFMETQKEEVI